MLCARLALLLGMLTLASGSASTLLCGKDERPVVTRSRQVTLRGEICQQCPELAPREHMEDGSSDTQEPGHLVLKVTMMHDYKHCCWVEHIGGAAHGDDRTPAGWQQVGWSGHRRGLTSPGPALGNGKGHGCFWVGGGDLSPGA